MPTTVLDTLNEKEHSVTVMIGIDPHKGSHTAVVVDAGERSLTELLVRSSSKQLERLLAWAERFPERTWAVENATGLGYLLAQQLVAAGERVLDVQPKLAARVRLLATESTNTNDPHDALSVAIAALRSSSPKQVGVEDHAAVMKLWARRHRNLSSARTQVACRLHAVLCDLVAGGVPDEIYAEKAASLLAEVEPDSAVAAAQVVAASGTTVIDLFGVGPVVAATVVGVTGNIARFPTRDRFAAFNGTASIEVSSGGRKVWRLSRRGNRTLNHAIHMAAITQLRFRHSPGRGYYDRKIAEGKTPKEALRALKRRISDAVYRQLQLDAQRASAAQQRAREGKQGTTPKPARPALTLKTGSSAKPLPDPTSPYDSPRRHDHRTPRRIPTGTRRAS